MTKTLIIGASGDISAAVTTHLISKVSNPSLVLISSRAEGVEALQSKFPVAEVVQADLYYEATLLPALDGVERIFMNVPDMLEEHRATPNLLSALTALGSNPHILRFCSYPPHKTLDELTLIIRACGFGAAKHYIAKEALVASARPVTFLNAPCWFMSNLLRLSGEALRERQCLNIPHTQNTPWISPNDIGEAAANMLMQDPATLDEEYVVTGPEVFDFATVAALMSSIFQQEIRYDSSVEIFRRYFGDMTDAMVEYFEYSGIDAGLIEPTETLSKLLGRQPETLASWLRDNRQAFGL